MLCIYESNVGVTETRPHGRKLSFEQRAPTDMPAAGSLTCPLLHDRGMPQGGGADYVDNLDRQRHLQEGVVRRTSCIPGGIHSR